MNKEEIELAVNEILYKHTDQNNMTIREVDYEEVTKDLVKLFAIPVVIESFYCNDECVDNAMEYDNPKRCEEWKSVV